MASWGPVRSARSATLLSDEPDFRDGGIFARNVPRPTCRAREPPASSIRSALRNSVRVTPNFPQRSRSGGKRPPSVRPEDDIQARTRASTMSLIGLPKPLQCVERNRPDPKSHPLKNCSYQLLASIDIGAAFPFLAYYARIGQPNNGRHSSTPALSIFASRRCPTSFDNSSRNWPLILGSICSVASQAMRMSSPGIFWHFLVATTLR